MKTTTRSRAQAYCQRINTILELRTKGKSFREIGNILGYSGWYVGMLYNEAIQSQQRAEKRLTQFGIECGQRQINERFRATEAGK